MQTLEVLLTGIFDYAGMYPPASLSFEEHLRTSARFKETLVRPYLVSSDSVLKIDALHSLSDESLETAGFHDGSSIKVACLGSAVMVGQDASSALESDRQILSTRFPGHERFGKHLSSYEIKLDGAIENLDAATIAGLAKNFHYYPEPFNICLEVDLTGDDWESRLTRLLRCCAEANAALHRAVFLPKIRGSGPTAITPERLARVLREVADHEQGLKATAGLHHPIIERSRYPNSLGFLNLIVALHLCREFRNKISDADLLDCLRNEEARAFTFDGELRWKEFGVSLSRITEFKSRYPFSIGSCSLHEPDEDLHRLYGKPELR